jgi:hypothetical protein
VTSADPHVDLDTLADRLEGLLDDEQSGRVDRHVRDCGVCANRVADLRGVTSLLAAEKAPSISDEVSAQVTDAIREAVQPAPQVDRLAARRAEPEREGHGRLRRALLVAAAAAVVVGVGGTVIGEVVQSGGDSSAVGGASESAVSADANGDADGGDDDADGGDADGDTRGQAAPEDAGAGGADELSSRELSLIEDVFTTRTGVPRRDRAACVGAALGDGDWVGTSYAVPFDSAPAVVAFPGDPDNTAPSVDGVLVVCEPDPRVVQRRPLLR